MTGTDDEWSGDRVTRWLHRADAMGRQFAAVSEALFAAAAISSAESVVDVGCGTGQTTVAAAVASGAGGRVTGVDVSAEMLAVAAGQPVPPGAAPLTWVQTDVVGWTTQERMFEVVLSRFGVMFFADPTAAMARLAQASRPDARLAFAVWGRRDESAQFELPYQVALRVCAERGHENEPLPVDRGPFSWHDDNEVRGLLEPAGWRDVRVEQHLLALPLGGGVGPVEAAESAVDVGPTRLVLLEADDATRAATRDALAETFAAYVDPRGHVRLEAKVRIVTARRS